MIKADCQSCVYYEDGECIVSEDYKPHPKTCIDYRRSAFAPRTAPNQKADPDAVVGGSASSALLDSEPFTEE